MSALDRFSTPRLRAERLTPAHWSDLRRLHTDRGVMAFLGGPRDDGWSRAYLARNLEHWARHGFGLWMLRLPSGGDCIGCAVLRWLVVENDEEMEIGYGFHRRFWGAGLATEVARACMALGRDVLGRESLVALTSRGHAASQRVLEKCGFTPRGDVLLDGHPQVLFRCDALAAVQSGVCLPGRAAGYRTMLDPAATRRS